MLQRTAAPGPDASAAHSQRVQIADYRKPLPFAAESFDLVVVHDSLDRLMASDPSLATRSATIDLMIRIRDVLVAGGVLAGCAGNRSWMGGWARRLLNRDSMSNARVPSSRSARSWRIVLRSAGFVDVTAFNVLPGRDAPLRLIDTDALLSRIGFRRELECVRSSLTLPAYVARRALVELALNRFLEESILIWGRKR